VLKCVPGECTLPPIAALTATEAGKVQNRRGVIREERVAQVFCCGRLTADAEGAAKLAEVRHQFRDELRLAVNPAGEGPASRTYRVATEVIPDGGEGDLSCRCSGVNVPAGKAQAESGPSGGLASQQAVAKGANRYPRKGGPTGSGLWWDR
jgi:hypothetical protein